jgi:OmpA-OmpF porin, OOP family
MNPNSLRHLRLGCAVVLFAAAAAQAQSTAPGTTYDASRKSWLPYTNNGYIGLNIGRSRYDTRCGNAPFSCDDDATSASLVVGGMLNRNFGLELGYLHLGDTDRAGGTTRAQGLNASVVGRVPVGSMFSLFGKLGTTYGRTRTDARPGSGIAGGKDSGWGPAYGLGASVDFSNNVSAVLEWQRHRFHFAGDERAYIRTTSLGVRYRF